MRAQMLFRTDPREHKDFSQMKGVAKFLKETSIGSACYSWPMVIPRVLNPSCLYSDLAQSVRLLCNFWASMLNVETVAEHTL